MRLQLATKILLVIVGVLVVAVASGVVALWSSWRVEGVLQATLSKSLASLRAAEELEIALLEQRGYASAYMLDEGDTRWLEVLERTEPAFDKWLRHARATANSREEHAILDALEDVYAVYDAQRRQAIDLYAAGEEERGKEILLQDVYDSYRRAFDLCESFIEANSRAVDAVALRARNETENATAAVSLLLAITVVMGAVLVWIFLAQILYPLRRMIAEMRAFTDNGAGSALTGRDELSAMGAYLQSLMSDMADTQTTLRQSRSQLEQSQKLASVGKLAASVAHEMRNPLTAVKMWLFSLRKAAGSDPALSGKFDLISDELSRLEGVVQNFLEFSRPPDLRLQRASASELVGKAIELLAHRLREKEIRVEVSVGDDLPPIEADPEQIKQVLINLIWNAVEAMDGGVVRLSGTQQRDAAGRAMVVLRVQDTGGGIPEEIRGNIYDPFFTTKEDGAGLGLSIAASIMGRHEGRLVLESSTVAGTCFAVWIPTDHGEENG